MALSLVGFNDSVANDNSRPKDRMYLKKGVHASIDVSRDYDAT
jgi:hypothetical protein